jgi:hypothetical protein
MVTPKNRVRAICPIAIVMLFYISCTTKNLQQKYFMTDSAYENYHYGCKKLLPDEALVYDKIGAKTMLAVTEHPIGSTLVWDFNATDGICQFGYSRTAALFFMDTLKQKCPVFKIDGAVGTVDYIMDVNLPVMTDGKLQYLLYLSYEEQRQKNKAEPFQLLFVLVNLQELQVVGTVTWTISHKKLGDQIYIF